MKKRYKHIYFESKKPRTRDSVFGSVKDTGKPGLSNKKEFIRLVLSQLADVIDYKTKDHYGKTIKWTIRLWNGRMAVLRRLNKKKKFGMSKLLKYVDKVGKAYLRGEISRRRLLVILVKLARKYRVGIKKIIKKTNK